MIQEHAESFIVRDAPGLKVVKIHEARSAKRAMP
jgi:hypothetical protein